MDELLNQYVTNASSEITTDFMSQVVQLVLIPSVIILVLILTVYTMRLVHRHKVDKAIFEIRDMLRAQQTTATPSQAKTVAAAEPVTKTEL